MRKPFRQPRALPEGRLAGQLPTARFEMLTAFLCLFV